MKFVEMGKMHPAIAHRRRSVRKQVGYVAVFDNGDIEYTIAEEYKRKATARFLGVKLEQARQYIEQVLKASE